MSEGLTSGWEGSLRRLLDEGEVPGMTGACRRCGADCGDSMKSEGHSQESYEPTSHSCERPVLWRLGDSRSKGGYRSGAGLTTNGSTSHIYLVKYKEDYNHSTYDVSVYPHLHANNTRSTQPSFPAPSPDMLSTEFADSYPIQTSMSQIGQLDTFRAGGESELGV